VLLWGRYATTLSGEASRLHHIFAHDMDIVFGYSDRIVALHGGKVLADGTPAEIRARADVVATVVGKPPATLS
jgi:ABC-type branched-subunit amino acid transport system ATPase component